MRVNLPSSTLGTFHDPVLNEHFFRITTATFLALEGARRRPRALNLLWSALLSLAPAAAWACTPEPHGYEAPTRFKGEAGEIIWRYGQINVAPLSSAEDLCDGYLVQHLRDGKSCYGKVFAIVQNCASGEAVAFGGHMGVMDPVIVEVLEGLNMLTAGRALLARHLPIADVAATARSRDVEAVVTVGTASRFQQGPVKFQLGQGCQVLPTATWQERRTQA